MHRHGITDLGQQVGLQKKADDFLKTNPQLLALLCGCFNTEKYKRAGRLLRRDTERKKRIRKLRRKPYFQLTRCDWKYFQTLDREVQIFVCPICQNVLKDPVTVDCGHTFCSDCLVNNYSATCTICSTNLPNGNRCVNVLLRDLVDKWRERNECTDYLGNMVPVSIDILGVEPRYHLRSGCTGFRINVHAEDRVSDYLHDLAPCIPEFKKRNVSANGGGQVYDNSFLDMWMKNMDYDKFLSMLDNVFRGVENLKEEALRNTWDCISITDLECILCSQCLLEPVTTSCGHTFCRGCLTRVLDHGLSCPLCMTSLCVRDYARQTTKTLEKAIEFLVPVDLHERVSVSLQEAFIMEQSADIPVFVCTNAFPGVACPLHVYEPKYRLLIRRCLRSPNKRFAMASHAMNGRFHKCGTILEIKDAISLEDGRFILATVGMRRYKMISTDERDGYDTAKVQYIRDCSVSADKLPELVALHEKVRNKASKWIRLLRPKVLAEAERILGEMPEVEENWYDLPDGPSWTWWLIPILPLNPLIQIGFLASTTLEKRLRALDKMLDHLETRMAALERHTIVCQVDSMNACGEAEYILQMPFSNR